MTPTTFGIIGTGWRSEFFLRLARAAEIAPLYDRLPDFVALMERLDPRGAFRNAWLEERVLGG